MYIYLNQSGVGLCAKGFLINCSLTMKFYCDTQEMPCCSLLGCVFRFQVTPLFIQIYFIFCRKELILSGTLNPLKDLHLGKLALTKFPKSPETWIHRFVYLLFCCLPNLNVLGLRRDIVGGHVEMYCIL